MNIIKFLFELVKQFAPIDDIEYHKLSQKGNDWYMKIMTSETKEDENKYIGLLKKHGNEWYTALALGVLYIFAVKWVSDTLNSNNHKQDEY